MAKLATGIKSSAAGISAAISAVASLSCCLPLGFLAALGLSGTSFFVRSFQPVLLGLSLVFLGVGFFQHYRASRCGAKPGPVVKALLWASALLVVVMILFPEVISGLIASAMQGLDR